MLKHPATFDHYAALRQASREISIREITWTYLIKERLRTALETIFEIIKGIDSNSLYDYRDAA